MRVLRSLASEQPRTFLAVGCWGWAGRHRCDSSVCRGLPLCSTQSGGGHHQMLWLVHIRSLMMLLFVRDIWRVGRMLRSFGGTSLVGAPAGCGKRPLVDGGSGPPLHWQRCGNPRLLAPAMVHRGDCPEWPSGRAACGGCHGRPRGPLRGGTSATSPEHVLTWGGRHVV